MNPDDAEAKAHQDVAAGGRALYSTGAAGMPDNGRDWALTADALRARRKGRDRPIGAEEIE